MKKNNATTIGKFKINSLDWYVPHYTASIDQERLLMKQIVDKRPTELQYIERFVFMKEVNTQTLVTFEFGTQGGKNVPVGIIVAFQQRGRQDSQNLANDTFNRTPVASCQCFIGTKNILDRFCSSINL